MADQNKPGAPNEPPARRSLFTRLGLGRAAAAEKAAEVHSSGDAPHPEKIRKFNKVHGRDRETGLPNRESIADLLAHHCSIATITQTRLSLLVVDGAIIPEGNMGGHMPDSFRALAAGLRMALWRQHDAIGSLGLARFAIILPFTDAPGAEAVARRIRANVPMVLGPADDDLTNGDAESDDPAGNHPAAAPAAGTPDERPASRRTAPKLCVGIAHYIGCGELDPVALLDAAERSADFAGLSEEGGIARASVPQTAGAGRVTFVDVPQVPTIYPSHEIIAPGPKVVEDAYKDPDWMIPRE